MMIGCIAHSQIASIVDSRYYKYLTDRLKMITWQRDNRVNKLVISIQVSIAELVLIVCVF